MFYCTNCGNESKKWYGKCPTCKSFNTLEESKKFTENKTNKSKDNVQYQQFDQNVKVQLLKDIDISTEERKKTNIKEYDYVTGGGLVPGSLTLLGGNPGIGKSTLLLQVTNNLSNEDKVLYISGEESASQIKRRADRLRLKTNNNLLLANIKQLEQIFDISLQNGIKYLIIDSIQTIYTTYNNTTSGSVSQLKETTLRLMYFAKQNNITIIIIGHVTKDGEIAGPKLLEHMVDTVLYLEGEKNTGYKILRSIKNRYGKVGEIGIFEMTTTGLQSVESVEKFFLTSKINAPGNVIGILEEGERNVFVEVQSLLIKSDFGYPKRTCQGYDLPKMNLLLGVIQKRAGINMSNDDCYLNISNGLKTKQVTLDLAVVISLISAKLNIIIPLDVLFIGEVGLSGEIKPVYKQQEKLEQAVKIGFKKIYCSEKQSTNKQIINCSTINEVIQKIKN